MFNAMTKELLLKDWSLTKRIVTVYSVLTLLSVGFMILPFPNFGHIGFIFLITAIIAFYCHLIIKLTIVEQKDKNHLFVMTLPVSVKQVYLSKFLFCLLIFLLFWATCTGLTITILRQLDAWPAVAPAFYAMIFSAFLPGFLLILAAALITEHEGWTLFTLVLSNVLVTVCTNFFPNMDAIKTGFNMGTLGEFGLFWPAIANQVIGYTLGLALLLILLILSHIHFNKRAFI